MQIKNLQGGTALQRTGRQGPEIALPRFSELVRQIQAGTLDPKTANVLRNHGIEPKALRPIIQDFLGAYPNLANEPMLIRTQGMYPPGFFGVGAGNSGLDLIYDKRTGDTLSGKATVGHSPVDSGEFSRAGPTAPIGMIHNGKLAPLTAPEREALAAEGIDPKALPRIVEHLLENEQYTAARNSRLVTFTEGLPPPPGFVKIGFETLQGGRWQNAGFELFFDGRTGSPMGRG